MRERYDPEIARLPVEITIAGSSGLGVLSQGQQPEQVFDILNRIGRKFHEHQRITKRVMAGGANVELICECKAEGYS